MKHSKLWKISNEAKATQFDTCTPTSSLLCTLPEPIGYQGRWRLHKHCVKKPQPGWSRHLPSETPIIWQHTGENDPPVAISAPPLVPEELNWLIVVWNFNASSQQNAVTGHYLIPPWRLGAWQKYRSRFSALCGECVHHCACLVLVSHTASVGVWGSRCGSSAGGPVFCVSSTGSGWWLQSEEVQRWILTTHTHLRHTLSGRWTPEEERPTGTMVKHLTFISSEQFWVLWTQMCDFDVLIQMLCQTYRQFLVLKVTLLQSFIRKSACMLFDTF